MTYRRSRTVVLNDTEGDSEEARAFKRGAPDTRSELSIPIKLGWSVVWILNLEDSHTNAFMKPEIEYLHRIISDVEAVIDRLFQRLVLGQVLDAFSDAVVIAQTTGNILYCNAGALTLFDQDTIPSNTDLSAYIPGRELQAALSDRNTPPVRTTLRSRRGKEIPIRLSKLYLPEEYDHVVLQIQDESRLQWQVDFERLKGFLAEVTSQVRVPLSMVSSFVQQIARQTQEPALEDLARKAVRQLGKIELTYDRVLGSYNSGGLPGQRTIKVDIEDVLEQIWDELPDLAKSIIELEDSPKKTIVDADVYQVKFALESMLTYLLRLRADASTIKVGIRNVGPAIEVTMSGAVAPVDPQGAISKAVEAARSDIALGADLLKRIAYQQHFVRERTNGHERLAIHFPAAS